MIEFDQNAKRWLILTVGLPYSGKTTWALSTGFPIVCRDAIHMALHGERYLAPAEDMVSVLEFSMVQSLFLAGHKFVIVDSINLKEGYRERWNEPWFIWKPCVKVFAADERVCKERALANVDLDIIPIIEKNAIFLTDEAKLEKAHWLIYEIGKFPKGG
jgi:hypothetical protein